MLNLAMVYDGPHSTAIDQQIIAASPIALIDNTPGGYWHGACNPYIFQPYGIHVFSYITSNYDNYPVSQNQAMIDAIAAEGCYGVFIDQSNPTATGKLTGLCNYAHSRGLKVIVNPGQSSIDAGLYAIADMVMTDEQYTGRGPNSVEASHLGQTIVIGYGISSASTAAAYTEAAWDKGFALSYHCLEYITLPSWLQEYAELLAQDSFPPTPVPDPTPNPPPDPTPGPDPTPTPTPDPTPTPTPPIVSTAGFGTVAGIVVALTLIGTAIYSKN
jgi:hypothetical protein